MLKIKKEIEEIKQSIDNTTLLFYQQKNEAGYEQLDNLVGMIMQGMNDIFLLKANGYNILLQENQLNQALLKSMKAMEAKDTILLSDILCYDVKELFNDVLTALQDKDEFH
jgi:uncharacterized protein (UPF0297 family)